jgi:hypothetical protein
MFSRGEGSHAQCESMQQTGGVVFPGCASHYRRIWLFFIAQQFSLRTPDLQAVPVNYVMIWTQGLGGFERQFQRLKRLHGMAAMSRDVKRSVYVMTLSVFSDISA